MSNIWIPNVLFHNPKTELKTPQCFLDHQHGALDLTTKNEALDLSMATKIKMEQQPKEYEMNINNVDTVQIPMEQELVVPEIKLENVETVCTEEQEKRPEEEANERQIIQIGPNGTTLSADDFKKVRWTNASIATRTLLEVVFGRQTLKTHTLSGKPSPALLHLGLPVKRQLNPKKVEDIICWVRAVFNCSLKDVRMPITMKCADMAKSLRRRRNRRN